jgi:uncharacterized membrane protein YukC
MKPLLMFLRQNTKEKFTKSESEGVDSKKLKIIKYIITTIITINAILIIMCFYFDFFDRYFRF